MKPGLITVVIPCYNVAPYLRRCLDSVINNTYRDLQIICVNDGSTDETPEILASYSDERITVISQQNQGLSPSRNVGIENAQGEFICFIDSDDWIHKEYFERLMEVQKKSQADIVVCPFMEISEFCDDAVVSEVKYTTNTFFDSFDGSMLYDAAWNKLYKADAIGDTRFVKVFAEDQLFNSTLLITQKKAVCATIDTPMYYYFQRPGSLMHVFHEDRMLALAQGYLKASEKAEDPEVFNYIINRGFKLGLSTRYKSMFRENLKSYRESCNVFLKETLKKMTNLSFTAKCLYSLFVSFPSLYRIYRKLLDPTMADWEKKEIELQKAK